MIGRYSAPSHRLRSALAVFGLGAAACSPSTHLQSPVQGQSSVAPTPTEASPPPLVATRFKTFELPEQSLRLVLPEGPLWSTRMDGTFWRAEHTDTHSVLLVKRWRQGELVDGGDCERQALLWKPALRRPLDPAAHTERIEAPGAYHTEVNLYLNSEGGTSQLNGRLAAYGASLRDCFIFHYATTAALSPQAADVVRQRLDVLLNALRHVEVMNTDDRANSGKRRKPE